QPDKCRRIAGSADQSYDSRRAKEDRRGVRGDDDPAAQRSTDPAPWTVGEDEREMQEQRRQREDRDRVGPVEDPVQAIETAAEREREDAEEGDGKPEEMQRRRIARAAQSHGGADQQRERSDRGEHEVER